MQLDRRRFLRSALTTAVVTSASLCSPPRLSSAGDDREEAGVAFDPWPFSLGVASGDPLPEGVVLWTKLGAEGLAGSPPLTGDSEVEWVVARDPGLRDLVRRGSVLARGDDGHSVHVDVDGLEPATTYWYAFRALGASSRTGRTRTAPSGRASRVRLALVSCASFTEGYFGAYRRLATESVDAVICTGDYYYERHDSWGSVRGASHAREVFTLEEYRRRIALYRGDPDLREAHAAHPWIVAWDDHEVANDYAGVEPLASPGAGEPAFLDRRRAAYRAFFEMMPIRRSDGFRVHRRFAFGDLVDLFVLDTRQFREGPIPARQAARVFSCAAANDPPRSILGGEQRGWLEHGLSESRSTWRLVAQQVMMAALRIGGRSEHGGLVARLLGAAPATCLNSDQWDGYPADRDRLLRHLERESIPDVVVLTGDVHIAMMAELRASFDDVGAAPVATEIVGPSIASGGVPYGGNGPTRDALYAANPHLRYVEGERRGYVVVDVDRDAVTASVRSIDDARRPSPAFWTSSVWQIARGVPGLAHVAGATGV
jgi:alkaline phosphatase D